jgi:hypothetical protein
VSVEWYYKLMGEDIGPLSAAELRRHALEGRVTSETYVRRGDSDRWVTADAVKGLFDSPHRPAPPPSVEPVIGRKVVEDSVSARSAEVVNNSRLVSCPDCGKSVSKRASQCPHCGCPLGNNEAKPYVVMRQPEVFDIVFRCVLQAVRDIGYAVQGVDKENGMIAFKTGISWWSFGQDIQLVVVDEGDSTCSIDMTNSYQALTDWGEGNRIGQKILTRARELLHAEGLPGALQ